ncbi:MAG: helix-turn-helix domain-containing protein [Alphaproteobacteria bacterium]
MILSGTLTIGDLSRQTGCKVQTIRYYEEIGLLPAPARSSGNQRRYNPGHLDRLAFIRHGRELGFSLPSIRELLGLTDHPARSCEAADAIARVQLVQVESRITRLQTLKKELKRMVTECAGGRISDCRVIEVLADHNKCLHENHLPQA